MSKKTLYIIWAIIVVSIFSANSFYMKSQVNIANAKTEIITEEAKKRIAEASQPSAIELKKERIESLRAERIEVQAQIDMKIQYKLTLIEETNTIKQELADELGL